MESIGERLREEFKHHIKIQTIQACTKTAAMRFLALHVADLAICAQRRKRVGRTPGLSRVAIADLRLMLSLTGVRLTSRVE